MQKKNSLTLNIAYNVIFQVLNIIVPIFTAPYVFRILGKEGIGLYGYSFSIAHYFSLFCMLGILNYGNREISMVSDNRDHRTDKFWQIYAVQFFAGLISVLCYLLFVCSFESDYLKVFLIQGFFVISSMFDISWFYFGIENFKFTTTISLIAKLITTVLIFLMIKTSDHVYLYAGILSLGALAHTVLYWFWLGKYVDFKIRVLSAFKTHIKPILILFIPVIAINIYKYIDKIMLGMMLNVSEVGTFEAAEKLQNLPMCLIAAIGTVMLPRISNMVSKNESSTVKHYNRISFVLVMFLTIGMAFGMAGISRVFIPLFYGAGYEDSELVLLILLPSMVFVGWANIIRTQYLLPNRMDTVFCSSVVFGAIINVISNFIFIPLFGAVGAAISTTIAEFTVCFYQSVVSYKNMNLRTSLKDTIPFVFVGLIMYFTITQIDSMSSVLTVVLRIATGGVVFSLLSVFFVNRIVSVNFIWKSFRK